MPSFYPFLLQAATTVIVGLLVFAVIALIFAAAVLSVRSVLDKFK